MQLAYADETILVWLNGRVGTWGPFDRLMEVIVSDYFVPVTFVLTLIGLWFCGRDLIERQAHQIAVFTSLAAMAFASLLVFLMNVLYERPRPFMDHDLTLLFYRPTDSAFPANAIAVTFAIATGIWSLNRRVVVH